MAPVEMAKAFDLLASRFAFRAASVHGVLWPLAGLIVLAVVAPDHTGSAVSLIGVWALALLALGGLPTLLLVRRSPKALGVAAALYGIGAAAVLYGGVALAIAAGMVGVVGPSAVAAVSSWKLMMGREAWAQKGVACALAAVALPLVVMALAVSGGHGLTRGLMDMGEAMGVDEARGPMAICAVPPCGGATSEHLSMEQLVAPLEWALAGSALCAVAALIVTRERIPKAFAFG